MRKKMRGGGKISTAHCVSDAAAVVVDVAQRLSGVTKLTLGPIQGGIKSKRSRLKFKEISVGWEVQVYGDNSIQILYIHTSTTDQPSVRAALQATFEQKWL